MPTQQSTTQPQSLEPRINSSLLYTRADGIQEFVHDNIRDFFLAVYVAQKINEGFWDVHETITYTCPLTPMVIDLMDSYQLDNPDYRVKLLMPWANIWSLITPQLAPTKIDEVLDDIWNTFKRGIASSCTDNQYIHFFEYPQYIAKIICDLQLIGYVPRGFFLAYMGEEVYDAFDDYEHDNILPTLAIGSSSLDEAKSLALSLSGRYIDIQRKGFLHSGSFTPVVYDIKDARDEVISNK